MRLFYNLLGLKLFFRNGLLSDSDEDSDEDLENLDILNRILFDIIEGRFFFSVLFFFLINSLFFIK